MTRPSLAAQSPITRSAPGLLCVLLLAPTLLGLGVAREARAAPVRIAVAPFAATDTGDAEQTREARSRTEVSLGRRVADAIARALAQRPLDRLIAPDAFLAEALFDPTAEQVRRWAYNAAVETIVVGRVAPTSLRPEEAGGEQRVEIVLRSGHSGAEIGRHSAVTPDPATLEPAADTLAADILEALGFDEPQDWTDQALHTVGFASPRRSGPPTSAADSAGPASGEASKSRGLDAALDGGGFDSEAPIEIKAEEAEIINRDGGRNLVFKRNVSVRQANVTLLSDYLEATYRKGESEPERLVARGKVFVDQGERRARCDRAVYVRSAQQLICTGHAELVQGCDIVRGQSIEFFLGEDRARVEGAASIVIRPDSEAEAGCKSVGGLM